MINSGNNVITVFNDRFEAEQAVDELEQAGFGHDQIGFVWRGVDAVEGGMITDATGTKDAEGAIKGATAGSVIGGVIGAAAAAFVPGIGPVISGGILAGLVGGAAAGAMTGGIVGAL